MRNQNANANVRAKVRAIVYSDKQRHTHTISGYDASGRKLYGLGYYEQDDALYVARKEAKYFGLPVIFRLKESKTHV
jgi:hypothetical protein